ncbi:MAG: glycosyltransferase family 2 protein [Candidatus Orphnella occulta]|nr:glycosyltransferase family 2 protein [Candidatus Orphnella occulta]
MKFHFSRHRLRGREKALERFFEVLPGLFSWSILIGMSMFSFINPLAAAVVIIAFDLYWLLRLFYMNIFLSLSYFRLSMEKSIDWMARAEGIDNLSSYCKDLESIKKPKALESRLSHLIHKTEMNNLLKAEERPPLLKDIYQLVIFPVARESREIVEPGIESLLSGTFPAERMVVVIALEDTAPDDVKLDIKQIEKKFSKSFNHFMIVIHPTGITGEARVKAANASFAARKAEAYFEKMKIPHENVICSCFDADTVVSADYFGCLTYHYLITPDRIHASFQPIPVFHNNIWQAPGFARVLDVGSSFFQLIEATNPEKLVTFSSHSMSFKALVDIDYWPVDMISDDSAIFWKAYIHYDGKYRVVPIYTTLSMDVTEAETWWRTVVNVYKQKRRWAYGCENIPIVMRAFLKAKNISIFKRVVLAFKLFDAHLSWTTWPFLLSIVSWLPIIFATRQYEHSMFYYSAPRIAGTIFTLASFGLIVCVILSLLLLPKRKVKHNLLRRIGHALEWLLIPPISILLSAVPALDAQTRLMLGKYMEFWVTIKKRKE